MVRARAGELAEKEVEKELGKELKLSGWNCQGIETEDGVKAISCRLEEDGETKNRVIMTKARIEVDSEQGVIDLERSPQATMKKV